MPLGLSTDSLVIKVIYETMNNSKNFTEACVKLDVSATINKRLHELFTLYRDQVIQTRNTEHNRLIKEYLAEKNTHLKKEISSKISKIDTGLSIENIHLRHSFLIFNGLTDEVVNSVWGNLTLGRAIEIKKEILGFPPEPSPIAQPWDSLSYHDDKISGLPSSINLSQTILFENFSVTFILGLIRKASDFIGFSHLIRISNRSTMQKKLEQLIDRYQLGNRDENHFFNILHHFPEERANQLFSNMTLKEAIIPITNNKKNINKHFYSKKDSKSADQKEFASDKPSQPITCTRHILEIFSAQSTPTPDLLQKNKSDAQDNKEESEKFISSLLNDTGIDSFSGNGPHQPSPLQTYSCLKRQHHLLDNVDNQGATKRFILRK